MHPTRFSSRAQPLDDECRSRFWQEFDARSCGGLNSVLVGRGTGVLSSSPTSTSCLRGVGCLSGIPFPRATHVARAALGMVSSQRSLHLSTSLFTKEMIVAFSVRLVAQCSNLITFCVTSLYPQHRVRIAAMREAQPVLVQLSETGNPYFVLLANLTPGL